LPHIVTDLYTGELLAKSMQPEFQSYYNIEFREGFNMSVHWHPNIEVMYVRKGSCDVYVQDERYRLETGDLILLNGDIPHRLYVSKGAPCRVLCLEFVFTGCEREEAVIPHMYRNISELRVFLSEAQNVLKLKDTMEAYTVLNDIYRELEQGEPGREVYIRAAFTQFLIKLARLFAENEKAKNSPADKYIKDAIGYMNENYHEELTVEGIAEHVSLNVSYFHKIFKQVTGETPMDYLNNIRISKARMLLEKSNIPVIEICSFVGFNSRQYFTYTFKKQMGMAPVEYRKRVESKRETMKTSTICSQYIAGE
jgi:AraC family transcriptional regulator, melibiose operon regulatory protein